MSILNWKTFVPTIINLVRQGIKWSNFCLRSPGETRSDPDVAIMSVNMDVSPDTVFTLVAFLAGLKKTGKEFNDDHPFFGYLKKCALTSTDAKVRATIRLEERE